MFGREEEVHRQQQIEFLLQPGRTPLHIALANPDDLPEDLLVEICQGLLEREASIDLKVHVCH